MSEPSVPANAEGEKEVTPAIQAQPGILPAGILPTGAQVTIPIQLPLPGIGIQQVQQVQVWQGQFPPPEAIERYAAVQPDSFDRIIRMAEIQQTATIENSTNAMKYQAGDTARGQYLGAAVALAAIGGAAFVASIGMTAVAIALVGIPVLGVAKALVDSATVNRQVSVAAKTLPAPAAEQKKEGS